MGNLTTPVLAVSLLGQQRHGMTLWGYDFGPPEAVDYHTNDAWAYVAWQWSAGDGFLLGWVIFLKCLVWLMLDAWVVFFNVGVVVFVLFDLSAWKDLRDILWGTKSLLRHRESSWEPQKPSDFSEVLDAWFQSLGVFSLVRTYPIQFLPHVVTKEDERRKGARIYVQFRFEIIWIFKARFSWLDIIVFETPSSFVRWVFFLLV